MTSSRTFSFPFIKLLGDIHKGGPIPDNRYPLCLTGNNNAILHVEWADPTHFRVLFDPVYSFAPGLQIKNRKSAGPTGVHKLDTEINLECSFCAEKNKFSDILL
jgi:hypothetical protein